MYKFIKTFETFVPKNVADRDDKAKALKILTVPPEHILINVKSIKLGNEANSKWIHDKKSILSFYHHTYDGENIFFCIEDAEHYSTVDLLITIKIDSLHKI